MSGFQVRQECGELAFVFGESDDPADTVALSSPAAVSFHRDVPQFAAHGLHGLRAFGETPEIDFERSGSVQAAQSADAIPSTREQDRELRVADFSGGLQFRGRLKFDADACKRNASGIQAERYAPLLHGYNVGPLSERQREMLQRTGIEQMKAERKRLARLECLPFQRRSPKDEGAGPIGEAARAFTRRRRFKDSSVIFRACNFTQNAAQRATQNISGHAWRKLDDTPRRKV
jgi:hypothetical protein